MIELVLSFAAGIALGAFYFYGLWLTLKQLAYSQKQVLLTLGSFFGRSAIAVLGFYIVLRAARLEGLAASLAGFVLMKFLLMKSISQRR